jgi:hypothetical protein
MPAHWRDHPRPKERFHKDAPDDVRVVVHDGGPRLSRVAPEVAWVRITGGEEDIFAGTVLNQPTKLATVSAGCSIQFKVPVSGELPLMVTEKYLLERPDWIVHPCDRCGLTELFDAPSDLLGLVFAPGPEQPAPEVFTAFCGWCGGIQLVQRVGSEAFDLRSTQHAKRWWEFWR